MQRVSDQVDAAYLQQSVPRPLPITVVLNLLGDYAFDRPLRAFLNPTLLIALAALVLLAALKASPQLLALPIAVVVGRLIVSGFHVWERAWDDLSLLRKGLIVRAHVLKLRPHRTITGEIDGALLDCAIPVAPRRTYIGSIWLADGNEALRLQRQGRIEVICLPRTPGTWRVLEEVRTEVRYDRVAPVTQIPQDI